MRRGIITISIVGLLIIGAVLLTVKNKDSSNKVACSNCNVIIIGMDTVGASHISSFGYNRQTTPTVDQLAHNGFAFTQDISPASWTVPSFMSLFTDLYPTEHKVTNKYSVFNPTQQVVSNLDKLSPGTETLATQFKKLGYITGGFTGDAGVGAQFGYGDGFDTYYDATTFGSIATSSTKALSWLQANTNKKFFMFLHGYDAHGSFKSPDNIAQTGMFVPKNYTGPLTGTVPEEAGLREQQLVQPLNLTPADYVFLNGIYDSKIRDEDTRIASFLSSIKQMGLDKNTVVVVLADHGEEWGEHGGVDHGQSLYDELVRVPLIFNIPGVKQHAQITQQVSSLDVAPTLFDILGVKPDSKYQSQERGTSLLPLMENKTIAKQDVFTETDYREFTHIRSLRTADGWKYIITEQTGKEELYNLNKDPGEHNNLISTETTMAQTLRKKVRDHLIAMGDNPDKVWPLGCLPVYPVECKQ